jgi:hypothetical protein
MTAGVANFALRKEIKDGECEPGGDWVEQAACRRDLNPLWITMPSPATRPHQIALADEICRECPVRLACLDWARSGFDFEGVAAGLLWPWAGTCYGGHGRGGRTDKWCGVCQTR